MLYLDRPAELARHRGTPKQRVPPTAGESKPWLVGITSWILRESRRPAPLRRLGLAWLIPIDRPRACWADVPAPTTWSFVVLRGSQGSPHRCLQSGRISSWPQSRTAHRMPTFTRVEHGSFGDDQPFTRESLPHAPLRQRLARGEKCRCNCPTAVRQLPWEQNIALLHEAERHSAIPLGVEHLSASDRENHPKPRIAFGAMIENCPDPDAQWQEIARGIRHRACGA